MKRAFNILAILFTLFAFALCAFAKYDVITLYGGGAPVEITEPCKILATDNLWNLAEDDYYVERICTLEQDEVTNFTSTNYTYTIVQTIDDKSVTNNLAYPEPLPLPANTTAYWTNTVVNAWSVTNTVPYVYTTSTNIVHITEGSNIYLAPGDRIFNGNQADATGKLLIFIEK